MKEVFYNFDGLDCSEIDETVTRVKAIILKDDTILLGYCSKTYQLPGGHLEQNEDNETGLIREVLEETGIELSIKEISKPLILYRYYNKNYHDTGKNRENLVYYYKIKTNKKPNMNNTKYDQIEITGNYELKYIKLSNLKEELNRTINDNSINKIIYSEIISVLKELNIV